MDGAPLRLGTRASALALWQANYVRGRLEACGVAVELVEITTRGDRTLDVPLARIGGKALFTRELDEALVAGTIDLAVHSLKDLPTTLPDGLLLAAVPPREDPTDAFVAHPSFPGPMDALPRGAVVATSSLRREAQLKAWRADLCVVPVRGNVDTRLAKLDAGTWHGLILASAGLKRLGLSGRIRERIEPARLLPAAGQGALGVVTASASGRLAALLQDELHDPTTASAVAAERALLAGLGGSCQIPIGAHARVEAGGRLALDGLVASLDGKRVVRERIEGPAVEAHRLGQALAERMVQRGGRDILDAIEQAPRFPDEAAD